MKLYTEKIEKDWGYELIRVNNKEEDYCSKILHIKENKGTSMHYHLNKHETFYVRKGTFRIDIMDPYTVKRVTHILSEGDVFEITRGQAHQLIAHQGDVDVDETSTYSATEDSYRVWREIRNVGDDTLSYTDEVTRSN